MVNLIPFSVDQIEIFILIFVRIITIIALLPVFGSDSIPVQLKVGPYECQEGASSANTSEGAIPEKSNGPSGIPVVKNR